MVKIIHTADIHLDSPFSLLDVQKAKIRKNELRETFSDIIRLAESEKADIMVIAGDLFDNDFVTKETTGFLVSMFASVPSCRFVIAPGNRDYIWGRSPYRKENFSKNVYIFDKEQVSCFSFPEIGVDVYGYAFSSGSYTGNPLEKKLYLQKSRINILVAHADVDGKSKYCPISVSDMMKSGFDYIALGHSHAGSDKQTAGNTCYAYSGCPEGRSFDECGMKSVIIAELAKNSTQISVNCRTSRTCKRHYESLTVDITGVSAQDGLFNAVKNAVEKEGFGEDVLLRVRLIGMISPETVLFPQKLEASSLGLFYLEVVDDSVPLLNCEALKNDISIRGAFFREMLPALQSEDEATRRKAVAALRYGLAALDGRPLSDM
ncbi:MAG: DNA repair exonuclease [Clostridia bacterium]|nr:DNA repair exonuclease [Clostridia bacterium]